MVTAAVAYYRMSTDKQDTSIKEQRAEVTQLARANGYNIIRDYPDEGISGDTTEKRLQFLKMIEDAKHKRDFEAILCWDQNRFGRFDSLEAGYWIKPLRDANVRLVTVAQGEIDWNNFAGRMIFNIQQEAKNQFLVDLSRNCTRSLRQIALDGDYPNGTIPYGYDKVFVDSEGREVAKVRYGETGGIRKKRGWKTKFVISEDPNAPEVIRKIFQLYVEQDCSLRYVCNWLFDNRFESARGGVWGLATVRQILMNEKYMGDLVYGKTCKGKYHTVSPSQVQSVPYGKRRTKTIFKSPEGWIIHRDVHEPLVTRETWDAAQEKLKNRKSNHTKGKYRDHYFLSGILVCGHCGRKMIANWQQGSPRYLCGSYILQRGRGSCKSWAVRQKDFLQIIFSLLDAHIFADGNKEAFREIVQKQITARGTNADLMTRLKNKISSLERKIDWGTDRLLESEKNITHLLSPKISRWSKEREKYTRELKSLTRTSNSVNIKEETDAVVEKLWNLRQELGHAEPSRLREVILRLVSKITVWWKTLEAPKKAPGKRTKNRHVIERAELCLNSTLSPTVLATSAFGTCLPLRGPQTGKPQSVYLQQMTKPFGLRHSSLIRHSDFEIRH